MISLQISLEGGVQPDALAPPEIFKNPLRYVSLSVKVFLTFKDANDAVWYEVNIQNDQKYNNESEQLPQDDSPSSADFVSIPE